ncbi:hypothetical protein AKO1_008604 [Acrasis kona]|uniref:BTB domain-containing protein n=1 Tax=Acrasis kona TaxID=1008807 RepID=A0AAW2YLM2_9EUKA
MSRNLNTALETIHDEYNLNGAYKIIPIICMENVFYRGKSKQNQQEEDQQEEEGHQEPMPEELEIDFNQLPVEELTDDDNFQQIEKDQNNNKKHYAQELIKRDPPKSLPQITRLASPSEINLVPYKFTPVDMNDPHQFIRDENWIVNQSITHGMYMLLRRGMIKHYIKDSVIMNECFLQLRNYLQSIIHRILVNKNNSIIDRNDVLKAIREMGTTLYVDDFDGDGDGDGDFENEDDEYFEAEDYGNVVVLAMEEPFVKELNVNVTDLYNDRNDEKCVQLVTKSGFVVYAHESVLCLRSKVFCEFFKNENVDRSVVKLNVDDDQSLKRFVEFIYLNKITSPLSVESYVSLIELARTYQVDDLIQICLFDLSRMIDVDHVAQIHQLALLFQNQSLFEICNLFIVANQDSISHDSEHLQQYYSLLSVHIDYMNVTKLLKELNLLNSDHGGALHQMQLNELKLRINECRFFIARNMRQVRHYNDGEPLSIDVLEIQSIRERYLYENDVEQESDPAFDYSEEKASYCSVCQECDTLKYEDGDDCAFCASNCPLHDQLNDRCLAVKVDRRGQLVPGCAE